MHWHRLHMRFSFLLLVAATTATKAAAGAATTATIAAGAATTATIAAGAAGAATTTPATVTPFVPPAAASPAALNSTCSRSKHVVLASFGEPEEYHTVSLYFASKFPNASVHHLWLHLGNKKDEAAAEETMTTATTTATTTTTTASALRWQRLGKHASSLMNNRKTHRRKSPVDWRAFYHSHGIHRTAIDMASLDAYHKLRRIYLHSSVNGYEYELLCFARFIGLHEFCSSKKIEQLTWIDADIPIFDPDFLDRVCLPRGYSIWALYSGSSFLSTMTCSEIGRFVDFMLDFYAKENRPALVRAINVHGIDNMDNFKHVSEKVRRAEPAFAQLGIDPKHFSDMFLFSKFLQDTNAQAAAAREQQEEQETEDKTSSPADNTPVPRAPRILNNPRTYIHQDENGGTIDPYFVPIISIKNRVPSPDTQRVCANETVWKQYYSAFRDEKSEAEVRRVTTQEKTHARIGLLANEGGNWIPIAGAHFQGDNCKDRLLVMFAKWISEDILDDVP